jgi:alkanesulfonate monooxygenase
MREYMRLGIGTFILSGYPHLEEAYRFAELVLPRLNLNHQPHGFAATGNDGPFGEIIANSHIPTKAQAAS